MSARKHTPFRDPTLWFIRSVRSGFRRGSSVPRCPGRGNRFASASSSLMPRTQRSSPSCALVGPHERVPIHGRRRSWHDKSPAGGRAPARLSAASSCVGYHEVPSPSSPSKLQAIRRPHHCRCICFDRLGRCFSRSSHRCRTELPSTRHRKSFVVSAPSANLKCGVAATPPPRLGRPDDEYDGRRRRLSAPPSRRRPPRGRSLRWRRAAAPPGWGRHQACSSQTWP